MQQIVTTPDPETGAINPMQPPLPLAGTRVLWSKLYGDSLPLALASAAQQHDGLVVIVTPDSQEAEQLQRRLGFFCADQALDILCFPD